VGKLETSPLQLNSTLDPETVDFKAAVTLALFQNEAGALNP